MFTLKHISSEGDERIYTVSYAGYLPHKPSNPDSMNTHVLAWLGRNRDEGESMTFEDGSIYIMNENGKTVASYHISPIASNRAA